MGAMQIDAVICGGSGVSAGLQAARSGQALPRWTIPRTMQVLGEPVALSR